MVSGNPAKIIKSNVYPRKMSTTEKTAQIQSIISYWKYELIPYKKISTVISLEYNEEKEIITLIQVGGNFTEYNVGKRTLEGYDDPVAEDLRDFLRRRGIKFFTGKPFSSIVPAIFQ